jgi:hypothetical protein
MGAIAEMKVDYDRMKKVAFLLRATYPLGGLMGPLMGGYAGGPEGSAINMVAHLFLGRVAFMTEYTNFFPIDIHETCNTTRAMLWLTAMCHQAMARNTHMLHFANTFIAAGPCTDFPGRHCRRRHRRATCILSAAPAWKAVSPPKPPTPPRFRA